MNRPEMQQALLDIATRCMSLADEPLVGKAEVQANKIFKKAQKLMRVAREIDDEKADRVVQASAVELPVQQTAEVLAE